MFLLFCESVTSGQCNNPTYVEVTPETLSFLDSYSGFVEEYYWVGFNSVIGLFIAGLAVGIILNQVRKLK